MKRSLLFLLPLHIVTVTPFGPRWMGPTTPQEKTWKLSPLSEKTKSHIDSLPANLKRKVEARRQPLGHVVPKDTKTKGCTLYTVLFLFRHHPNHPHTHLFLFYVRLAGGTANPKLRPQGKAREAGLNNPSLLKISGGTARGKRLDSPDVYLRPMMGKVREAIYSTLQSFGLYDERYPVRHLDLFAGSGSVGLESLSRGAGHCTFCDFSQNCCDAVQRNIQWCRFDTEDYTTQVVCADVVQLLQDPYSVGISQGETFGIVTMGPPYEEVVYGDLLTSVANSPLVREDTIVVIEYPVELWGSIPHVFRGEEETGVTMVGIRNRKYGRTVIAMYICNPTGRIENAESRPEEFI